MKTTDNAARRAAMVARDRSIVMRESARMVRTTDAAHPMIAKRQSRDVLLSAEPTAHNPSMMGRRWIGDVRDLKAGLAALSVTDRAKAMDAIHHMMVRDFNYGNTSGMTGDDTLEGFAAGATPEAMNDAARAFYDGQNRHVTRDGPARDPTHAAIQNMQRAANAFWDNATAHQHTKPKEWGKG